MHLSDTHFYDDGDDDDGGDDGGGDDVDDGDNDIARPHIASRAFLSVCGAVWCVYVECNHRNHRNLLPTKQTKKCCSTSGGSGATDDDDDGDGDGDVDINALLAPGIKQTNKCCSS